MVKDGEIQAISLTDMAHLNMGFMAKTDNQIATGLWLVREPDLLNGLWEINAAPTVFCKTHILVF
jgi:hypothetical protein